MKVVSIVVVLLAAVAMGDECLDRSVARSLTSEVATINGLAQVAHTAGTKDEVAEVFQLMTQQLFPAVNRFFVNVYVGLENDNFYGVYSCRYTFITEVCPTTSSFYYVVRNTETYGGDTRRRYATLQDILDDEGTEDLVGYPTTDRFWYTSAAADTASTDKWWEYEYTNGQLGQTHTDSSRFTQAYGMIIGADRDYAENCDYCIETTELRPMAEAAANDYNLRDVFLAVTQENARQTAVTLLLSHLQEGNGDVSYLFFGLPNGDFHGVIDCGVKNGNTACNFRSYRYVYAVRDSLNEPVGDSFRSEFFDINNDGEIVEGAIATGNSDTGYDSTVRPWYQQGNGFTAEYAYTNSDIVARSYVYSFYGGVMGSDPTLFAFYYSCSPAATVVSSMSVLLMALFAVFA